MDVCKEGIFKEIFMTNCSKLQTYLQGKGLSKESAADVAQDSFTKLWENCQKVTPDTAIAFLFATAKNKSIDLFRKHQVRLKNRVSAEQTSAAETPEYTLEVKEFQARLEATLDSMNEGQREVFLMSRFEKMKYKEIASALEISVKAVEKRMSNALQYLVEKDIIKRKK